MKQIVFISFVFLILTFAFASTSAVEKYSYSDFSIQLPETWQAVERERRGKYRSWLFGKQATENESGVSIAIYIHDIQAHTFSSEEDLMLTKDRWLNNSVNTMAKNKRVLNTSVIYDEVIDGENFRAVNFRSLFEVLNQPDLNLKIYGRLYLTIMSSKVITVNFQASDSQEDKTKPELEKIVETIRWVRE